MAPVAASASCVGNAPGSILLDVRANGGARRNATTACSKTSTGLPIEVTFFTEHPPVLSHFSVHCPGLQLQEGTDSSTPRAIASDADLVLLRVPVDPLVRYDDYFVYRAHPQDPKLDLLPKPSHDRLEDKEIAILSCADDQKYAVAALKINPFSNSTFTLYLYRPKPDGEQGSWRVQQVFLEEPLLDRVWPISGETGEMMYHLTTKVITPGGAKGTIGWVDLWHGILLCDVLDKSLKLRHLPLPSTTRDNKGNFLNRSDNFYQDITVSERKDSIKYVEMDITPPSLVTIIPSGTPNPDSYLEWVGRRECLATPPLVPGRWKVTTWIMSILVTPWEEWRIDCTAKSTCTRVDNPSGCDLLHKMSSSHKDKEASQATLSLGSLGMAYPTMSIDDDDVVYLLTRAAIMAENTTGVVVTALDVRENMVRGVSMIDRKENTVFKRCYLASGISKHLNTTGTSQSFGQAEEHKQIPTRRRRRRGKRV